MSCSSGRGDTKIWMAKANIKPRIRMTTLYLYAAINNYLVVEQQIKVKLWSDILRNMVTADRIFGQLQIL